MEEPRELLEVLGVTEQRPMEEPRELLEVLGVTETCGRSY